MDKQNFDTTVNSLFSGMDHVLSSKTVVGEPQDYWRYDYSATC